MAESLTVNLSERSYGIRFAADLSVELRQELVALREAGRMVVVVTDTQVAAKQAGLLTAVFGNAARCVVEAGEGAKSLPVFGRVLDFLAAQKVDRGGVVFAVGGGVIGDLTGFAAASYLRGVDFFQVPTTLLAMVDSSVGGKTGINLDAGKNLAGAFHQPRGVFVATSLLRTLPAREFAAGMAEVIKYGLLGDAALFARLAQAPLRVDSEDLPAVIRRCCAIKAKIVEADERETAKAGGRALLNLGHTFGHAIERVSGYGVYLHGEAVAVGLVAAAHLSQQLGYIGTAEVAQIKAALTAHALPVHLREALPLEDLVAAMMRDKKVRAGLPRFVVMQRLGEAITHDRVEIETAEQCFREVGARD
jgi:3-dehydroquinate synthase